MRACFVWKNFVLTDGDGEAVQAYQGGVTRIAASKLLVIAAFLGSLFGGGCSCKSSAQGKERNSLEERHVGLEWCSSDLVDWASEDEADMVL